MKIADVTYEGPMRTHYYNVPSGDDYNMRRGEPVPVYDVHDVERFESQQPTFDVSYTVQGWILKEFGTDVSEALDEILDYGYRQKQSIAKRLGIKANQKEEELEEELEEQIQGLQSQLENQ